MAVVIAQHNPGQDQRCLFGLLVRSADMAVRDSDRIRQYGGWINYLSFLRSIPHIEDLGAPICGDWCCPIQRENDWSDAANCWERTKRALAGAAHFLPVDFTITVWDRQVPYIDRKTLQPKMGRHISIREFDTSYQSQKPIYPRITGMLPKPELYLAQESVANFDEAEARKWGAVGLDVLGGVGGAVVGAFGGPQSGESVSLAIKTINDSLVRPGGVAIKTAPAAIPIEHGISTNTLLILGGIGVATVTAVALIK